MCFLNKWNQIQIQVIATQSHETPGNVSMVTITFSLQQKGL